MSDVVWQTGRRFTHRSALQPALYATIGALIAIDAVWVHFLVASRAPLLLALAIDAISVASIALIWLERRAMGRSAITVERDAAHLHVGWKYRFALPLRLIGRAYKPTFRDIPPLLSPARREFVDLTKPAAPNVMIELNEPIVVRTMGIVEKPAVKRIALHMDDPDAFVAALAP